MVEPFVGSEADLLFLEQDMCTFINIDLYDMSFEEASEQAIIDMKEVRKE